MAHDAKARHEAAAKPLVLFGSHGRTIEGYRPTDDDLAGARAGNHHGGTVRGPHRRRIEMRISTNRTGVVGISVSRSKANGRHYLHVQLGSTNRKFCVETLGRTEAWRRAVALRREHVRKVVLANAVILHARETNRANARLCTTS